MSGAPSTAVERTVVIADDHPVVRRGLASIIAAAPDLRLVGEAANGEELLVALRAVPVDIAVVDLSMPGLSGLDLVKQLRVEFPSIPVLVVSMHPTDQFAMRVLRAGAAGYLTKEAVGDELLEAIRRVADGGRYVTSSATEMLLAYIDRDPDRPAHESLSDREFQVLQLLASGKTVSLIGEELSLSVKTVSTYRCRLLDKLGMENNAELTRYAIENSLV